jgi:hypothetical protein
VKREGPLPCSEESIALSVKFTVNVAIFPRHLNSDVDERKLSFPSNAAKVTCSEATYSAICRKDKFIGHYNEFNDHTVKVVLVL